MTAVFSALAWAQDHIDLIALILGFLLSTVEVARATGSLRQGILALMLRAEKAQGKGELGGLTGEQIMNLVTALAIERVVPLLPIYVRPFFTERAVRRIAVFAYAETKLYLETGRLVPAPAPTPDPAPAPAVVPVQPQPAAPQEPIALP